MTFQLLTDVAASLADFKRDPMRVICEGAGEAVTILHQNKPAFYAIPPALYEAMLDVIDDALLTEVMRTRRGELTVRLDIDGLTAQAEVLDNGKEAVSFPLQISKT
ncbi:MAG: plasmid stability protein StbD, antitoxin of toxin-antitoxin stability system [Pseudomonas sp. BRH_c35]|nr:MAG: plasmid stability protein StbD, antitoxin of toxin-antitoxin stability system [Pseudomonas sp. BRH_c35]